MSTIEHIDFFDAGVKGVLGSKFKVFQEVLKTYGKITIENGQIQYYVNNIDQKFAVELFYRILFLKLNSPKGEGENFAWDVLKKMTRSEVEDATNKVIDDLENYFKEIEDE